MVIIFHATKSHYKRLSLYIILFSFPMINKQNHMTVHVPLPPQLSFCIQFCKYAMQYGNIANV